MNYPISIKGSMDFGKGVQKFVVVIENENELEGWVDTCTRWKGCLGRSLMSESARRFAKKFLRKINQLKKAG